MAYNNAPAAPRTQGSYAGRAAAAPAAGNNKPYEKDPSEVGFAYEKTSDKGGTYLSVTITADVPAGAKVMVFENKTKNRTEKTPTHVLKLSNQVKK